jgi:hypothetical protein
MSGSTRSWAAGLVAALGVVSVVLAGAAGPHPPASSPLLPSEGAAPLPGVEAVAAAGTWVQEGEGAAAGSSAAAGTGEGPPSAEAGGSATNPADLPAAAAESAQAGPAAALAPPLTQRLPLVRVPKPEVPPGPRRVGLQAGHWLTDQVPDELRRLEHSTGASWGGVPEWRVNLDVANRAAAILRDHGYHVDVLPTAIPPAYLADVFVALHADGDLDGSGRGFKAAHASRRGPYEDHLVRVLVEEYGRTTHLPVDPRVSRNMLGYYAFSWSRFEAAAAPHTPAAILEMGFLTSAADRTLLLGNPDLVALGVARGVLRFLDEVPAGAPFAEDLLVPPSRRFRPTPSPG